MSSDYIVYGLEDPRDHLCHYVGITDDVYRRFSQHIKGIADNREKNDWIFACRRQNVMIVMQELERVNDLNEALEREQYWIRHYIEVGHPITNLRQKDAEDALYQKAKEAWESGKKTNRDLASSLGITYYQAQALAHKLR